MPHAMTLPAHAPPRALLSPPVIGVVAFLTVVDLFATQAILPALARAYGVSPAAMGIAVNAATFGMAAAGLAAALLPARLDRRRCIAAALAALAVPTALLAFAGSLSAFAALRVAQGVCMATAFTLTLAHLGEACTPRAAAGAFAAYIAGNVGANLLGRLAAASLAESAGLAGNFLAFAALNLAGAALVLAVLRPRQKAMMAHGMMGGHAAPAGPFAAWAHHLGNPALRLLFGIGFCTLFVFLGCFTYVNFVLVGPGFALPPMALGLVYLVFLPAIVTTPLAGQAVARLGRRGALFTGCAVAALGLALALSARLSVLLTGLALVGVGTFLVQAIATGAVGALAQGARAAASGLYLAAYYTGGLIGTALLGLVFDAAGWPATVAGMGAALGLAALLGAGLPRQPAPPHHQSH